MVVLSLRIGCAIAQAVSLSFFWTVSIHVGSGGHSSTGVGFVEHFSCIMPVTILQMLHTHLSSRDGALGPFEASVPNQSHPIPTINNNIKIVCNTSLLGSNLISMVQLSTTPLEEGNS